MSRVPVEAEGHIHESPKTMTVPLMILAFFSSFPDGLALPVFGCSRCGAPAPRWSRTSRPPSAKGTGRRRLGVLAILERVQAQGALADHLTLTRAADLAVALMTDDVCDATGRRGRVVLRRIPGVG